MLTVRTGTAVSIVRMHLQCELRDRIPRVMPNQLRERVGDQKGAEPEGEAPGEQPIYIAPRDNSKAQHLKVVMRASECDSVINMRPREY
jgi:hypothetical protein